MCSFFSSFSSFQVFFKYNFCILCSLFLYLLVVPCTPGTWPIVLLRGWEWLKNVGRIFPGFFFKKWIRGVPKSGGQTWAPAGVTPQDGWVWSVGRRNGVIVAVLPFAQPPQNNSWRVVFLTVKPTSWHRFFHSPVG